jgi:hypothetical protein
MLKAKMELMKLKVILVLIHIENQMNLQQLKNYRIRLLKRHLDFRFIPWKIYNKKNNTQNPRLQQKNKYILLERLKNLWLVQERSFCSLMIRVCIAHQ